MITNANNKDYLTPDYDDDEDIEDFDEDIDEEGEDELSENFLDNNQINNVNNKMSTPFGTTNQGTPWGSSTNNQWGGTLQNQSPWSSQSNQQNNPWNSNSGSFWQKPAGNTWGSSGNSWNTGNNWAGGEKKSIDRTKRIIFCDVLDCLVETYQSNGRPGLLPRGIYDIKFRFDVWDKIACFNPEKIFAMVPRALINSNNRHSWVVFLEYVVCSLSEYLRAPQQVCQILLQTELGQPKEEFMMNVLKDLPKDQVIQIGVNSGLYGQNNSDQLAAMRCEIDYIDLATFMNSYF